MWPIFGVLSRKLGSATVSLDGKYLDAHDFYRALYQTSATGGVHPSSILL